jgi:hypothetical protein
MDSSEGKARLKRKKEHDVVARFLSGTETRGRGRTCRSFVVRHALC